MDQHLNDNSNVVEDLEADKQHLKNCLAAAIARAEKAERRVEAFLEHVVARYCLHNLCPHDTYQKSYAQCKACWRLWLEGVE